MCGEGGGGGEGTPGRAQGAGGGQASGMGEAGEGGDGRGEGGERGGESAGPGRRRLTLAPPQHPAAPNMAATAGPRPFPPPRRKHPTTPPAPLRLFPDGFVSEPSGGSGITRRRSAAERPEAAFGRFRRRPERIRKDPNTLRPPSDLSDPWRKHPSVAERPLPILAAAPRGAGGALFFLRGGGDAPGRLGPPRALEEAGGGLDVGFPGCNWGGVLGPLGGGTGPGAGRETQAYGRVRGHLGKPRPLPAGWVWSPRPGHALAGPKGRGQPGDVGGRGWRWLLRCPICPGTPG